MSKLQLDEASYQEGRAAFRSGASLRSIFEQMASVEDEPDDIVALSGALGFADALLDLLRSQPNLQRPFVVGGPYIDPSKFFNQS